jgi:hypothetical protein
LPDGTGGMQAGAGGELAWDTVALPFGVVSKPTTWMSPAVTHPH